MSAFDVPKNTLYASPPSASASHPTAERERMMLEAIDSALAVVGMMSAANPDTEWDENDATRKSAAIVSVYGTLLVAPKRDSMDMSALKGVAAIELFFAYNPSKRPEPAEERIVAKQPSPKTNNIPANKQAGITSRPWHPAGRRTAPRPSPLRTAVVTQTD